MYSISGLYAICDPKFSAIKDPILLAENILKGGCGILQLRMKGEKNKAKILQAAQGISALKKEYDFIFIINDFVEVALEVGADGVHVGADDASIAEVRSLLGKDKLIGYSSHNLIEAEQAVIQGADYVALGAIFPTPTKEPGHPVCGLSQLKKLIHSVDRPVVAIGGITRGNLNQVLATGVQAVAMITEIVQAEDISERVRLLGSFFN